MPSLISGYEYDIFISYRQNDNRSGWVTEFVKNLQEELAATIKKPVSVYFDANPHDGLRETYDVDDSLKGKLKSYILIPVISQTYCDTNSFAWKHEFLAFKTNEALGQPGLKIKLINGNVASRILPICIHELDPPDKQLLEGELASTLRGIDFIYKTAGVIRPLNPVEEDSKGNLNHTYYRDQINKVARAVKELLHSTHGSPIRVESTLQNTLVNTWMSRRKIALAAVVFGLLGFLSFSYYYFGGFGKRIASIPNRSIAVLPFENISNDPEQDYFSNGMAEDILNHLNKISDLKVKSRTSTLQYKDSKKSIPEIGAELGVANILEGSVRRVGDQVRIVVQLIDTETDVHLWSETYDRELKDILALQSEIAIEIANTLRAKLSDSERENIQQQSSQNVVAYEYFLRAREGFLFTGTRAELETVLQMINHAIKLDPNFAQAYALKARTWFNMRTFGVAQKTWEDSSEFYFAKAMAANPSSPDAYIGQGIVAGFLGKMEESNSAFTTAYKLAPNNSDALYWHGVQLIRDRNEKGAEMYLRSIMNQYSLKDPTYYLAMVNTFDDDSELRLLDKAKAMGDNSLRLYTSYGIYYWWNGEYDKAIEVGNQAEKIAPESPVTTDIMAWAHFLKGDLENAAHYWSKYKTIEARFEDSTQIVGFRARLGMVFSKMGRKKEADALVREDMQIHSELLSRRRSLGVWYSYGTAYYHMAVCNTYFGNNREAVQYLDSALQQHHIFDWGYHHDPLLFPLKDRNDFKEIVKKVDDFKEFRKVAFSNATTRLKASGELKTILK